MMRWIGVLCGSVIGSAVVLMAWAWRGGKTEADYLRCTATSGVHAPVSGAEPNVTATNDVRPVIPANGERRVDPEPGTVSDANAGQPGDGAAAIQSSARAGPVSTTSEEMDQMPGRSAIREALPEETRAATRTADAATVGFRATMEPQSIDAQSDQIQSDRIQSDPVQSTLSWHRFWRPFSTEVSARGFATRLEQLTGLDFRVQRAGVGRYEVAFAHVDDADKQARLARIRTVTGLEPEPAEAIP